MVCADSATFAVVAHLFESLMIIRPQRLAWEQNEDDTTTVSKASHIELYRENKFGSLTIGSHFIRISCEARLFRRLVLANMIHAPKDFVGTSSSQGFFPKYFRNTVKRSTRPKMKSKTMRRNVQVRCHSVGFRIYPPSGISLSIKT